MAEIIDDDLKARILGSIAGNSLVMLCGAGLSMAPPCSISSAKAVAQHCAASYKLKVGIDLPGDIAVNIELLAEYFFVICTANYMVATHHTDCHRATNQGS